MRMAVANAVISHFVMLILLASVRSDSVFDQDFLLNEIEEDVHCE